MKPAAGEGCGSVLLIAPVFLRDLLAFDDDLSHLARLTLVHVAVEYSNVRQGHRRPAAGKQMLLVVDGPKVRFCGMDQDIATQLRHAESGPHDWAESLDD